MAKGKIINAYYRCQQAVIDKVGAENLNKSIEIGVKIRKFFKSSYDLMNYLYDDYQNRGKSFYSHIESNQVTPETLYTAFKMQASYGCGDINSAIKFTVFTYDDLEDFDDDNKKNTDTFHLEIKR